MNIKLTELRISNYFYPKSSDDSVPFKVCYIGEVVKCTHFRKICNSVKYAEYKESEIFAIPLTKQWLDEFGFEENSYKKGYIGKSFSNQDFVLTEPRVMGEWQKGYAFEFKAGGWSKFREFNYVHELQNFYFAMTSEELVANLM